LNNQIEDLTISTVISILDILVILLLKDDPIIFIVCLVLLKVVTKDRMIQISFILLTIVTSEISNRN
jgi:hypothetical protein